MIEETMSLGIIQEILMYKFMTNAFIVFVGFLLLAILYSIFRQRSSKNYREFIADMFVAGKIRQYADKDKIDIVAENKSYNDYLKKNTPTEYMLDNTVRAKLQERINDDTIGKDIPGEKVV